MKTRETLGLAAAVGICALLSCRTAIAQDAIVAGSDNPNLAGRSSGYSCCNGDSVPDQSPEPAAGLGLHDCAKLGISATGEVDFAGGATTGNNPDGDDAYTMQNYGDGISAPKNVRTNALVGVFLDDESPTGKPTPPELDFADGLAFQRLEPGLRQIFFIGNGKTSDSKLGNDDGDQQVFVVPPGATRLFFGTVDGSGWFNNSGSFVLSISTTPYDPPFDCGDAAPGDGIFAADALIVLRTAVGSGICNPCVCDVDRSGSTLSSDALRVLRYAVGQPVEIACPCCPDLE